MPETFIVVKTRDISKVDFSQVTQRRHSFRCNSDRTKILLSYVGDQPAFVFQEITRDLIGLPEYSSSEILEIINKENW